jgi:hypothetical protein
MEYTFKGFLIPIFQLKCGGAAILRNQGDRMAGLNMFRCARLPILPVEQVLD